MTRVGLLDRNHIEEPSHPGLERPHGLDIGEAGFFYVVPYMSGSDHTVHQRVIGRRSAGTRTAENRIIAIINLLYMDNRSIARLGSIIAHPFAERPLGLHVAGLHETFNDYFSMRGKREACGVPQYDVIGHASQTAAVIILR